MYDGTFSTIERALQLAKTGEFETLSDIRKALEREGFPAVMQTTQGGGVIKQLRTAMKAPPQ